MKIKDRAEKRIYNTGKRKNISGKERKYRGKGEGRRVEELWKRHNVGKRKGMDKRREKEWE